MRFQREPMKRLAARCAGLALILCALGGAFSARAVPTPVVDANDLYLKLGVGWTVGDLELELPPGDYDISLTNLAGAGWASTGILPGNLTLVGRGFPGEVRVATSNLTLKVSPGLSLNLTNLKFSGAVGSTGNAVITLNRVWWAAPTPMIVPPAGTLNMDSSVVQGGGFAVRGNLNVRRCTFITGDLNLTGSVGLRNIDTSIFMTAPIGVDGSVTGVMNFIAGGGTTFPQPNFAVATTPPAPIFTPNSGSTLWWPGKLQFSLYPRNIGIAASPTGPTADFENEPISGRPEIGADEVDANLPTPSWAICQVSGPNGTTIYDDVPNRQVPIVSNGTPVSIRVVTRGLITPAMQQSGEVLNISVVITPEIAPNPSQPTAFEIPIPFSDIRPLGTTQDFEFTTTFAARDANPSPIDAFDGFAQVHLKIEGSYLSATTGGTTARDRDFLIDSLPPLLPPAIGDSTAYSLVTSTADADGVRVCGGWVRNDSTNTSEGNTPQYLFNSANTLDYTLTVPLVDDAGSGGHSVAGFQASGTLLQDTFGDLADVPERDPVLRNATWGTASLTNDALRAAGGATLTAAAVNAATSLIPGVAQAAVISVGGFTETAVPPKVRKWDMNLRIADRAGNTTVLTEPVRFWWMPPGSTWATVVGDNKDPISPSFSWDLTLNGASGSVKDFFTCGLRPEAQILLMQQSTVTTDPNDPGWESAAGLNWTFETTEPSVDSTTVIGRDPDTAVLGDFMRGLLGQNLIVLVRGTDPAGNVQNVLGLENPPYATTASIAQLSAANINFAGVYTIPSTPPLGSLDTGVSARFFLNRTDSGDLWQIDDNETTLGSGPTVPLTPLNACSQRLEAEFTINVGTSNQLPTDRSVLGVEFWLYEAGTLVAHGNLYPRNEVVGQSMRLLVPTDLIDVATGGNNNPTTVVFVPTSKPGQINKPTQAIIPRADVAKFLAEPPQVCADLGGGPDRLGDDGPIVKPGATNDDGTLIVGKRNKAVQYTLVLQATTSYLSSEQGLYDTDLIDPTPASYRFSVVPDLKPDSENPRVKVNTNNP